MRTWPPPPQSYFFGFLILCPEDFLSFKNGPKEYDKFEYICVTKYPLESGKLTTMAYRPGGGG